MNLAFVPITTVSAIVCYTYIFGLFNILKLSVLLLVVFGVTSFGMYTFKSLRKQFDINQLLFPGVVVFIGLSIYFFFILGGVSLLQYDNFSHWGSIVKEMFYFNSFPDERTIITFRNYPPGTACLIYPLCKILRCSESNALIMQSLIISASISTLFCKVKFKNITYFVTLILISVCSIAILGYTDTTLNIYNLLVDAVLGYVVVAALVIAYYYRDNVKKLFNANVMVLSMLALIKDSGVVFLIVVCICIFVLVTDRCKSITREKCFYSGLILGIPFFLSKVLWPAYNKKAYLNNSFYDNKFVVTSEKNLNFSIVPFFKHMSLICICILVLILLILFRRKFKIIKSDILNTLILFGVELFFAYLVVKIINLLSKKSDDDLHLILSKLFHAVFDFRSINTKLFFTVNAIAVFTIVLLIACKKDYNLILKSFVFTNSLCIFYLLELYVLYAIIMNIDEGLEISAFDRYFSTYIIISYLIQTLSILHTICHVQLKKYFRPVLCILIVIVSFVCVQSNMIKLVFKPVESNFTRHYIQQICNDKKIGRDEKVVIYMSDIELSQGYYYYLCTYELLTNHCMILNNEDMSVSETIDKIGSEKYLIILKNSKEFWSCLSKYNISVDNYDGQVYSISKEQDKICFNKI